MIRVSTLACVTIVVSFLFAASALCQAQAKCPWLNAATAAGVLGGEVELSVSSSPQMPAAPSQYPMADQRADRFDVSCDFHRKAGEQTYRLKIEVSTLANPSLDLAAYLAHCPSKVPLIAIGNEAFQCRIDPVAGAMKSSTEQVIGRVRNRVFVLTLDRAAESAEGSKATGLREDTRNIAEQVAGSLF